MRPIERRAWRQEISGLHFAAPEMTVRHVPQCYSLHKNKKQLQTKLLFTTKKPGAFPSPMPNEFGVCMVYGRCCTEVRRRAPYMSLPSFLPRQMMKSWISLLFFQFTLIFYLFPEKVREKAVPFLLSITPQNHFLCALGNIWSDFLQNRGPFMPLYYISNGRSSFLKRRGKFFLNSIREGS